MNRRSSVLLVAILLSAPSVLAQAAAPGAPAPQPAAPAAAAPAAAPAGSAPPAASPADPSAAADPAAPSDPSLQGARDSFRLGSALARQGQWNEALAAFERSQLLQPHPVTLYNVGYVERALGHYTRAHKALRLALSTGAGGGLPPATARETEAYLAEIERKLARAVVKIDPDTKVAIDGRPLEREDRQDGTVFLAGTAPSGAGAVPGLVTFNLIADPGRHVIVLSRPGSADRVVDETLAAGSTTLELSMTPSEPAPAPAAEPEKESVAMDTDGDSSRTWMWVAYGVGGAGIVAGSVFGILAINKKGDLDDDCTDGECPSGSQGDIDTMNNYALGSTIGFAVGGVGAALGTYLLLSGGPSEEPAPSDTALSARPWVGLGSAGVSGSF